MFSKAVFPSDSSRWLQGLTLLVIEDELVTQGLLLEALQLVGAHVALSTTCQAALALLKQQHFDVILSNIVLPDGSGYAMLQQWRQWEFEHGTVCTPAVAVTAAVTTVNRAKAVAAGFQSFVSKPYDFEQLFSAVAAAAGKVNLSLPTSAVQGFKL